MPKGAISTKEFQKMLKALGFVQLRPAKRGHAIYRHSGTGLLASLPTMSDEVPAIVARAITRQIEDYDIASRDKIEEILHH
jgi:predicted RNA binding protein YcfA (HicA-like mRNA interferase family)